MRKCLDASELISFIGEHRRVFVHGAAATPTVLLDALVARASTFKALELIHLHTEGMGVWAQPKYASHFSVVNLFVGPNIRPYMNENNVDYLPCFLSEIPELFRSGRRAIDVALIQVSPPDQHGYCSLGTSVDVARAAIDSSKLVLAQVNRQMPRVHGDGIIHIEKIDHFIEVNVPLPQPKVTPPNENELKIGRLVSSLIEDGSTLQVGIGSVPDAVLSALKGHRHLGVHTETWSDGMLKLLQSGAVDNSKKIVHPGKTVSSFVTGSQALYDYINDNPSVIQLEADYVNNPHVISRNPKVVAINSAVEIDLTGQICADSIGSKIISGVGGQMDFIRGASLSKGGKPIIALTSQTKKGISRIVPTLKPGAGVVTTRAHVHYVITEYGIADLYGKTLGERVRALIEISSPLAREELSKSWHTIKKGV